MKIRFAIVIAFFLPAVSGYAAGVGTARSEKIETATDQVGSTAVVTDARLANRADDAELHFAFSHPVKIEAFVMSRPDRVVIDMPEVSFALSSQDGLAGRQRHAKGVLVGSYRFGLFAPGRSRIVIALSEPARIAAAGMRISGNRADLAINLVKTDRVSFEASARSHEAQLDVVADAAKAIVPVRAASGKEVVVIDPGHGGPDMGAAANGTLEKDITLSFAKLLASKLEASGRYDVVMTRSTDVFVPLSERVALARRSTAALMISVHADMLPETAEVSGATVYTVSDRASDAYAAKVAAKENSADLAAGVSAPKDSADVNDILFDLTRQETRAYSHVFARTLVNYWKVAGRLNKNPQRSAGFIVLRAPDVPSILLELGYLSNAGDAGLLNSDPWREKTTGQMVEAINSYFEQRKGSSPASESTTATLPAELHQVSAKLP